MKASRVSRKLPLGSEGGFTLIEALVAMLMMVVVLFALYAIFDASVRVFRYGDDRAEATEDARLGLETLERDLRAAAPYDPSSGKNHLFFDYDAPSEPSMPAANAVTFGVDSNGRCALRRATARGCTSEADPAELVSYYVNRDGLLIRRNNNLPRAVVENVESLKLDYFTTDGARATSEADIARVDVTLVTRVGRGSQALTTSVALRNRGG